MFKADGDSFSTPRLSIGVIVASLDRPESLVSLLEDIGRQTLQPARIIVAVTKAEDLPKNAADFRKVEILMTPKGSCVQRNRALDAMGASCDLIFFCDDDYVPSRHAFARAAALFSSHPKLAGATGHLIADGAKGLGIDAVAARMLVKAYDSKKTPLLVPYRDLKGLYGCNMVFRASAVGDVRFDERLPLYGWQEDIDFSARIQPQGRLVKTFAFAGVHCGIKAGRSPGRRIGYSQVVNPLYLTRKGTMEPRYAAQIIGRNLLANHLRAFTGESWADRIGRVRGNWLGLWDIVRGRITPERIKSL